MYKNGNHEPLVHLEGTRNTHSAPVRKVLSLAKLILQRGVLSFGCYKNNFWLKISEEERSKCAARWVGMEEGVEECACQFDPEGDLWCGWWRGWWPQPPCSEVELRDRPLSARVCGLAVDALAVAFHLGQVLVEDLARPQRWHQVVKLATVFLPIRLRFPGPPLLFPLLFKLLGQIKTNTYKTKKCVLVYDLVFNWKD